MISTELPAVGIIARAASPSRDGVELPLASLLDTLRVGFRVLMPIVAGGTIARRPRVMALEEIRHSSPSVPGPEHVLAAISCSTFRARYWPP